MSNTTTAHWYSLSASGAATLCTDRADAEAIAKDSQEMYPRHGPYKAVQLVPVSDVAAVPEAMGDEQIETLIKKHARQLYSSSQLDWEVAEFHRFGLLQLIHAILALRTAGAVPDGWRLVPVEPTDAMVQAAFRIDLSYMPGQEGADRAAVYRAMLTAAPPAPKDGREKWRLLETGDRIESADELLHDDCVTWGPLVGWEVGMTYNLTTLVPMRRKVAAQAGGEQA